MLSEIYIYLNTKRCKKVKIFLLSYPCPSPQKSQVLSILLLVFLYLSALGLSFGMQDLGLLTRDRTQAPCIGLRES